MRAHNWRISFILNYKDPKNMSLWDKAGIIIKSFLAVRYGYRRRDKMLIFLNRILHMLYPLNRAFFLKYGRSLIEPIRIIPFFYCKNPYGIFKVPGGNNELQFMPTFEPAVRKKMMDFREGVFVDVGAAIGIYTIMMSKLLGNKGQVISIEAHPRKFAILTENIRLNNCKNVTAINVACWSESDNLKLYEHVFGGPPLDHSLMVETRRHVIVKAERIDDILKELGIERVGLIKIDVEGAEVYVLQGMKRTLENTSPQIIFEAEPMSELLSNVCDLLKTHRYTIFPLRDEHYLAMKFARKGKNDAKQAARAGELETTGILRSTVRISEEHARVDRFQEYLLAE